jgi:hypothetical protein
MAITTQSASGRRMAPRLAATLVAAALPAAMFVPFDPASAYAASDSAAGTESDDTSADTPAANPLVAQYQIASRVETVPASETLLVNTFCPVGTFALAGGESNDSSGGKVLLVGGWPIFSGTAWHVVVQNYDSQPHTVTGYTVCGNVANYQVRIGSNVTIPGHQLGSASLSCPAGSALLGGGPAPDKHILRLNDSQPLNTGTWWTEIINDSSESLNVNVWGTCATDIANHRVASRSFSAGAGQYLRTTVACPAGTTVLGGGAGLVHGYITDSFPSLDGREWIVYTLNNTGVQDSGAASVLCAG